MKSNRKAKNDDLKMIGALFVVVLPFMLVLRSIILSTL